MLVVNESECSSAGIFEAAKGIAEKCAIKKICMVIVGPGAKRGAANITDVYADMVIEAEYNQKNNFPETVSTIIEKLVCKYKPTVVAMASNLFNKEVAGRLSAKLDKASLTDCTKVSVDENGDILAERLMYGGRAIAVYLFKEKPAICTLSQSLVENLAMQTGELESKNPDIVEEVFTIGQQVKELIAVEKIQKSVELPNAKRIVGIGRGLNKKEDITMIEQLANQIEAEIGCSRPISEDFKWLPIERQIGLTGENIKAKVYFAVGISGQIQHIVGATDAKIIVAINNNKNAPIFEVADYGIVGDLYEIVPMLTEYLKKKNNIASIS
jgi:electron transfer flavoprotein alpha subunit